MTTAGSPKRTRAERVAALALPPGQLARMVGYLRRGDVLLRLGLCALATIIMWAVTGAWAPPFPFRSGQVPPRDIVSRVTFGIEDKAKTQLAKDEARRRIRCIYVNDLRPLVELQQALKNRVIQILGAESYEKVDKTAWDEFLVAAGHEVKLSDTEKAAAFDRFRQALSDDLKLERFDRAVDQALVDFRQHGLMTKLPDDHEGSQIEIFVHPIDDPLANRLVELESVFIPKATLKLQQRLAESYKSSSMAEPDAGEVAKHVYTWLAPKLPTTLRKDSDATRKAADKAEAAVTPVMTTFEEGMRIVDGGRPLTRNDLEDLLWQEHLALLSGVGVGQMIGHSLADFGMYVALYILCGFVIYYRERRLLTDLRRFVTMLGLVVVTVTLCKFAAADQSRAELIPLILFGMTVAIAYERELALLLTSAVALVVVLSLGHGLVAFVILVASAAAAIQLLDRVRSRTKLIYVGLWAALVALFTTMGVGMLATQAFGAATVSPTSPAGDAGGYAWQAYTLALLTQAAWYAFCAVIAGLLMTGLLPFIERLFDVQTDISLLELGDAAHPLLQELVRRAPGTYNHSINVASISEAAAEAIGANGLLCRVGAYFHDIGKMLKPSYFVENQGQDGNRHDSLMPAMSTLVIIAHVKDGADLARQHGLPQSIINFIEQHHGTTLVEYFYRQATKQSEEDPDASEVNESNFRYPGPKPQTKEAGVMMLADAVESASRTLVDPTPSRIENLVHQLAMNRLLDDQYDECGLTLRELHLIEQSLIKSLTAVYHGRVKYPGQQTA
jgi:putative nucleotidyltransferase with HDIG domain